MEINLYHKIYKYVPYKFVVANDLDVDATLNLHQKKEEEEERNLNESLADSTEEESYRDGGHAARCSFTIAKESREWRTISHWRIDFLGFVRHGVTFDVNVCTNPVCNSKRNFMRNHICARNPCPR